MALTKDPYPEILWTGRFLQMKNSRVESLYADFRTYMYKGKVVDKLYHLGVDLAAVKRHPVEAANSGIVLYADDLGIYGNAVLIDHGLGLTTLYSHMSSIDVSVGDRVDKGTVIGRTGATGFAGGDHLHFGILIHGVPVNPIEWWDRDWVRNRITRKINEINSK